jgi:hypothetical protein
MDDAELVIEEKEIQVIPESSIEFIEDEDIPFVEMIECQPRPAGARRTAGDDRPAQVVDVIANPRGAWYLTRDAENIARWFAARGLSGVRPEPADLAGLLCSEALL